MGNTYQQAVIPIGDPQGFGAVQQVITSSFSTPNVREFLKSLERSSLRVRDFEAVLGKGALGASAAGDYARLSPADQGQLRELYLASLERVEPELRNRFFKLYAYY